MKKYNNGAASRRFFRLAAFCAIALMSGCGGGGSSSSASKNNSAPIPAGALNVQAVTVDAGPTNNVNLPFTTVTVCTPGSADCRTIDHVLVDTGSAGLRIFASALSPSLALPQQAASNGVSLAECTQFVDGYVWGPIKQADLKIAGEQARSIAIQVGADPQFSDVPAACSNTGPSINTVQSFGANGVLGIGVFAQDCGPACAQSARPGIYFGCTASNCQSIATPLTQQVQNPVSLFAVDNNGVIIKLPAISPAGAATVTGSLVFGIGTQTNNALGSASVLAVNEYTGNFTTVLNNKTYSESFLDSGSNALYFADGSIPLCTNGFYCPSSLRVFSASNTGTNGISSVVSFNVANADSLSSANPGFTAFNSLAGPNPNANSFDWGLPFFFGRNVFTAIEGKDTTAGTGPYIAY